MQIDDVRLVRSPSLAWRQLPVGVYVRDQATGASYVLDAIGSAIFLRGDEALSREALLAAAGGAPAASGNAAASAWATPGVTDDAPAVAVGAVTTQQVRDAWPEILDAVAESSRSAWAVVYTATVRALDGDVLSLRPANARSSTTCIGTESARTASASAYLSTPAAVAKTSTATPRAKAASTAFGPSARKSRRSVRTERRLSLRASFTRPLPVVSGGFRDRRCAPSSTPGLSDLPCRAPEVGMVRLRVAREPPPQATVDLVKPPPGPQPRAHDRTAHRSDSVDVRAAARHHEADPRWADTPV